MKSLAVVGVLNIVRANVVDIIGQHHDRKLRRAQGTTTCTIDLVVYEAGESLGDSFSTRCGSASDWPCYCAPDLDPPISCPYCGIPDLDQGLVCARDGESVSIVNLDGIQQQCSCTVDTTGTPQQTCVEQSDYDEVCTIELVDGEQVEFQNGESFGELLPTRCKGGGEDYPCVCNTTLPDQVQCPYCTFVDMNDDLICARANETIVYEKSFNDFLQCTCFDGTFWSCIPIAPTEPVATTDFPTISPTIRLDEDTSTPSLPSSATPSLMPLTASPMPSTESPNTSTPSPSMPSMSSSKPSTVSPTMLSPDTAPSILLTETPTESPSVPSIESSIPTYQSPSVEPTSANNTVREPTIRPSQRPTVDMQNEPTYTRPPFPEPELGGCIALNADGEFYDLIEEGAVFGDHISGPCSPISEWPVYCNPNIPNGGLEYPYCVFNTSGSDEEDSTGVVCARSEERVNVTKPDGTTEECSCLYFNPLLGAVSSCELVPFSITSAAPTKAPTSRGTPPDPTGNLPILNDDGPEDETDDDDNIGRANDGEDSASTRAVFGSINISMVVVCTLLFTGSTIR